MKKLLIVEDEPVLMEMYLAKFTRQDLTILSANSAEQGFAIAKKERPDLILLDILLPMGNGIDLLEKIRKDEDIKDTKVLTFSNYDDISTKKKAIELGSIDYLIKTNYTPNQIFKIIQNILKYDKNFN
ncbi:MAG: response regulator [Candidatus Pacebacteria bacterium]|nr:response regulator [Candidatus Paceibacterota bacterium]